MGLLLVYLGVRINPESFWPLAFPGLIYPVLLIINVVFILYWLLRFKIYFVISLLIIIMGWSHVRSFIQINNIAESHPVNGKNISLLSYNVRVFDIYNYGPNWEHNFTERNNIFRFLEEKDFDIICFQEFVHDKSGSFKTLDTIPTFLNSIYSHTGFAKSSRNINFFGVATFSAYPIVGRGNVNFHSEMGNSCIYSDIKIGDDTIRVYNAHFESIGLSSEDYLFVDNITNAEKITDRDYIRHNALRILKRMRNAFIVRTEQIRTVAEHIENSPYPVILAGDFNDTPASWSYRKITRRLEDAFLGGRGIGQTYIGIIPGFRIDYIFHSPELSSYNFTTGDQQYSDHYPIWTWLNIDLH